MTLTPGAHLRCRQLAWSIEENVDEGTKCLLQSDTTAGEKSSSYQKVATDSRTSSRTSPALNFKTAVGRRVATSSSNIKTRTISSATVRTGASLCSAAGVDTILGEEMAFTPAADAFFRSKSSATTTLSNITTWGQRSLDFWFPRSPPDFENGQIGILPKLPILADDLFVFPNTTSAATLLWNQLRARTATSLRSSKPVFLIFNFFHHGKYHYRRRRISIQGAIPSALQFSSWDNYQWFQQGRQASTSATKISPITPSIFTTYKTRWTKSFYPRKAWEARMIINTKHNVRTESTNTITRPNTWCIYQADSTDVAVIAPASGSSPNYNYDNVVYDETTTDFFFWNNDKIVEIDQTTDTLTQKTTCTPQAQFARWSRGGYLYAPILHATLLATASRAIAGQLCQHGKLSKRQPVSRGSYAAGLFCAVSNRTVPAYPLQKYSISGGMASPASRTPKPNKLLHLRDFQRFCVRAIYLGSSKITTHFGNTASATRGQ